MSLCFRICALSALLLLKNMNILRFLIYVANFLSESVGSMSNTQVLWEADSDGDSHAGNLVFREFIRSTLGANTSGKVEAEVGL